MVDSLIPQSVRLKQRFEVTPRLIDDYEIAAAIGLACRDLGEPIPEGRDLEEMRLEFSQRTDLDEHLRRLIESRETNGRRTDWRRMLEVGYNYEG